MSCLRLFIGVIFVCGCSSLLSAAPLAEAVSDDKSCKVTLTVSPDYPTLADTITLTIDVIGQDGELVTFPPFGETLGTLNIADIKTTDQQLVLTATPSRSGKTPIWAMTIQCGQQRLVIPQAELDIAAEINTETASLDNIGLETESIPGPPWGLYAIIAAGILTALILLWLFLRRKKTVPEEITPLSAQELALQRLAALLESRKHESDVKDFFVELSNIVRWYVERLTGIHAPELTTEEFLHNIAQKSRRHWGGNEPQNHYSGSLEMLVPFLESADIVKFAKHVPTNEEIMLAFRRAEHFIQHHVELHTGTDHVSDSGVSP